jgi:sigma-B regulation protein RsbU (phosphoserine phosphatase)
LLLYTDGVTEAEAADLSQFGEDRMRAALASPTADAAEGVQRIVDAVDAFAGGHPQSDDITLLLVRRR